MKTSILLIAAGLLAAVPVQGQLFIPTVKVGDAGNANDSTGFGGVDYEYHIGTYEVTNAQYTAFLNAVAATDTFGLYNSDMANSSGGITRSGAAGSYTYTATRPNAPVNYVSFWDAARFTNWLTTGNTETGVYVLDATGIANNIITRDAAAWADGGVGIASENEWYKAAYFQPAATGGDSDDYWLYPTKSNSITTTEANYAGSVDNVTDVGTYTFASYYGTFDQGGNVWEWNDTMIGSDRGLRGGSFLNGVNFLQSSDRGSVVPADGDINFGFRVSSLAPIGEIPEPAHVGGVALLLLMGWIVMRRRTL